MPLTLDLTLYNYSENYIPAELTTLPQNECQNEESTLNMNNSLNLQRKQTDLRSLFELILQHEVDSPLPVQ